MTDLRTAAQALFNECLASDFNEHWDSYKALEAALAQQDVCAWTWDAKNLYCKPDCNDNWFRVGVHQRYMKHCLCCGKPIKFLER